MASPDDKRYQVMGGRTRKLGYCGHVPICASFGDADPFMKKPTQQQQQTTSSNRMTQDNTSLRKGMSSNTSYAAIAHAVEEKHRKMEQEKPTFESEIRPAVDDTPRDNAGHAPHLREELFGCSPPRPKLISGFSGHRAGYGFVVGASCNAANREEWRQHVYERESKQHQHSLRIDLLQKTEHEKKDSKNSPTMTKEEAAKLTGGNVPGKRNVLV